MKPAFVQNPIPGQTLTPSVIRSMNTEIRRNKPIAGRGIRITNTAGGAIISCTDLRGGGGGGGGGIVEPDRGCWNFTTEERETGEYDEEGNPITETATIFGNQYMMLGDILQKYELDTTVDSLAAKAIPEEDEEEDTEEDESDTKTETGTVYICLRHNATGSDAADDVPYLEGYPTWNELHAAQIDLNWHTIPIYMLEVIKTTKTVDELDENGEPTGATTEEVTTTYSIKCDFRKGIFAQQAEIIGSLPTSGGSGE